MQTEVLRARLAAEPRPDAIYASTLRRSRETAEAIAAALRVRPRLLRSLREIDCGRLDGWLLQEVRRAYPELWQRNLAREDDEFHWPEGESYRALRRRGLRAVRQIAARHAGGRVAIVTHAGVITQVLGALHGVAPARLDAFVVGNASLTEVRWDGDRGTLVRFDDRDHLAERLAPPDRVGATNHPQLIAGRAAGLGAGARRGAAPAIRDDEVVA
jgi:broad specificity phosphatase PhoE